MLEWQFWLILGIIFVVLEIITPTFFFLWFGIAAFITSIFGIFITNYIITSTIFIILSTILWLFSRKIVKNWMKPIQNVKFHLDELINKEGIALTTFDKNNSGIVKVNGEEWRAYSKDEEIKKGDKIIILKRDSNILIVKKQL
ncbi:Membrane protein implicated in regulation of membrane protease activity [Marinitoga hydrogenitolerans DSM 16785]|uniref:Membrane protein implicated in regulation of membrane protease activity n=1 Tax=Marinitoga hydrogenitolerans (strain DSM 16785 / JCM 12826 / AT1271) TaxID=1122195 RepID=A0A1M4XM05_MARH1|nr:NfeD family protein [Marinitoga hydrogenitolerans]SHE94461.1 Membrane protein implicated in regulation of membrane protease activity [Marinitoga hydrogenitolerans DSM 16785]